jgi:integrase
VDSGPAADVSGWHGQRPAPRGAYLLLATTGMRRGEALGLGWQDVDLDAGRASIRQTVIAVHHAPTLGTPKTTKGRRTVVLDAGTVAALREHRKRPAAERLQMGSGWTDHGLGFCQVDGTMLHPERFSRSFGDAVRRLGLPPIRLHDLRHGWATIALSAGVHPKVVQERLGHANIAHHAGHLQPRHRQPARRGGRDGRGAVLRRPLAIR